MSLCDRPAPRASRTAAAVIAVLVLALVAGCGVRLETPVPAPPTPGVDESARQRAAADAATLAVLAGPADPPADPAADPLGAARAAVAAAADAHGRLLGGLYDDGVDAGAGPRPRRPAATPSPGPTTVPPDAVVDALVEAAATARTDAGAVRDGRLARLLGSLSVSRLLSAARLAAAAGLAPPPVPEVVVPGTLPAGLRGSQLSTLVAAEDAAGYALEVVAAKHRDDLRARAARRAATHRERAGAWARAGGVDGTGRDPRRVAYALPGGLEDAGVAAALVADLESTLATDYLALVATVAADARTGLVDATTEATAHAVAWGDPLPSLPGMPEHAAG